MVGSQRMTCNSRAVRKPYAVNSLKSGPAWTPTKRYILLLLRDISALTEGRLFRTTRLLAFLPGDPDVPAPYQTPEGIFTGRRLERQQTQPDSPDSCTVNFANSPASRHRPPLLYTLDG